MAPHSIVGVLFDKDATLVDFQQTWGQAVHAIIQARAAMAATSLAVMRRLSRFSISRDFPRARIERRDPLP